MKNNKLFISHGKGISDLISNRNTLLEIITYLQVQMRGNSKDVYIQK